MPRATGEATYSSEALVPRSGVGGAYCPSTRLSTPACNRPGVTRAPSLLESRELLRGLSMKRFAVIFLMFSCACFGVERQSNADYRARREKLAVKLNGGIALVFADNEAIAGDNIWGFH